MGSEKQNNTASTSRRIVLSIDEAFDLGSSYIKAAIWNGRSSFIKASSRLFRITSTPCISMECSAISRKGSRKPPG